MSEHRAVESLAAALLRRWRSAGIDFVLCEDDKRVRVVPEGALSESDMALGRRHLPEITTLLVQERAHADAKRVGLASPWADPASATKGLPRLLRVLEEHHPVGALAVVRLLASLTAAARGSDPFVAKVAKVALADFEAAVAE